MIEFDKGQHMAMVQLSLMGVSVNVHLDLKNIKSEALLKDSRLDRLSSKRLKALLEYSDHTFKIDPKSSVPWKEQFLRKLSRDCDMILSLPVTLSTADIAQLRKSMKETNLSLVKAAKALPDDFKKAQKLSFQYHDGFHHLTRDDDFFAVRQGNRIVSIIPLPGNDFNEVKRFLEAGSRRVLSEQNIGLFRFVVKEVHRLDTKSLLEKTATRTASTSLKLMQG